MNPAALVVNIKDLKTSGIVVVNTGNFKEVDLKKADLTSNPLNDGTLEGFRVIEIDINQRVAEALSESSLSNKDK
jgi:2-oxoglutarate ferredoxin oxidoreductase subunit alpha